MARRRSTVKTTKISPTYFGKGPMGGPTGAGRMGAANRAAIRRNTSSQYNPLR